MFTCYLTMFLKCSSNPLIIKVIHTQGRTFEKHKNYHILSLNPLKGTVLVTKPGHKYFNGD